MKYSPLVCAAVAACAVAVLGSGCVVVPAGAPPGYGAPAGAVYVAPTYAVPGVGYAWQYHSRFGWGWHHHQHGWHRGWR